MFLRAEVHVASLHQGLLFAVRNCSCTGSVSGAACIACWLTALCQYVCRSELGRSQQVDGFCAGAVCRGAGRLAQQTVAPSFQGAWAF